MKLVSVSDGTLFFKNRLTRDRQLRYFYSEKISTCPTLRKGKLVKSFKEQSDYTQVSILGVLIDSRVIEYSLSVGLPRAISCRLLGLLAWASDSWRAPRWPAPGRRRPGGDGAPNAGTRSPFPSVAPKITHVTSNRSVLCQPFDVTVPLDPLKSRFPP